MMVEGYLDRLPREIVHNIALMLPFSSIIQLKCSSKYLYNLLTDPEFVDLHLAHALEKPPGYLFSPLPKSWFNKKACYFVEQSRDQLSTSKIFEYPCDCNKPKKWDNYFQSSGGLMCAYSSESCCFRIFNPHIAEEVQVPRDPKFKKWWFISFVFGYSPSIKQYKILKMGKLICGSPVAEICTLGSNIWREIVQNAPNTNWDIGPHTQCQGNPFWMEKSNLHFFDLVSEKFHVIPGPPVLDFVHVTNDSATESLISMGDTVGYMHKSKRLWVLEDRTNVFSHDMGCTGLSIMKMKLDDRGGKEDTKRNEYIAPHVRSFVSPVRIIKMGKKLNRKEKWVFDTLKLDYDATKDDLLNKIYELLQAHEKDDKGQVS